MRVGIVLIAIERARQVAVEEFPIQHDLNEHNQGQLSSAAICYVLSSLGLHYEARANWPWESEWFKPKTPIRDLVRAGALIAAEIDRRQATGEKQ